MLERNPDLFSENYKQFYCLHNDPDYLKLLKTDILSTILTNWNVEGIVEELCDNILEVSNEVAKQFLQTICNITLRYESVVTFTFARLLQFLALEQAWLISSCFVVIAGLLFIFCNNFVIFLIYSFFSRIFILVTKIYYENILWKVLTSLQNVKIILKI